MKEVSTPTTMVWSILRVKTRVTGLSLGDHDLGRHDSAHDNPSFPRDPVSAGCKIVNVYQPAGRMEEFFRELGNFKDIPTAEQVINKSYTEEQINSLDRLFDAYGMDLLGPPLGYE